MNRKNKKLVLLILLGILYLLAAGWAVVTGCTYLGRSRDLVMEIEKKENELRAVRERAHTLPERREEYLKYHEKAENLTLFVPTREEQERFIVELERLAGSAGVRIRSCRMQEGAGSLSEMPAYQAYRWDVLLTSRYRQLDDFLALLDKADRLVKVADMTVRSASAGEGEDYILNVDLKLDLIVRAGG